MPFPTQEHIDAAETAADRLYPPTGFYAWPSAALAQALIESDGWTKLAAPNNGFGIKATPDQIKAGKAAYVWTWEEIGGRAVKMQAWFAAYDTLADAYQAHAELFVRVGLYDKARHDNNPRQFVVDMAPHYASAKNYPAVIIDAMDRLNLYQFDHPDHKISATTPPLKPPASMVKKAQAAGAGGIVAAGAGAIAAVSGMGHAPLFIGLALAVVAGAIAVWRYRAAHAVIAGIPPTPPPPQSKPVTPVAAPAAVSAPAAAPTPPAAISAPPAAPSK